MITEKKYKEILKKIGKEVNALEYIDHLVIMNDTYYYSIIHLNGKERFEKAL